MNKEEALKVLEISDDPSGPDVVCKVKQRLKKLHKDSIENLSEKIEACKFLTDGQEDQAEVFSDLVISAIDDDKPGFLELLLKTVENDDKFNYLNTEGTGGNIPLNFALGYTYKHESRIKAITLLLKHGADPNTRNREGKSSLHCVINNSDGVFCHKVTESLLNKGADPNAKDSQGKTLLHYLFEDSIHDRVEVMRLLLTKGADPNIKNERGESLLYEACSKGRDSIVKLLLEHSADPNIKDQEGRSLFYYIIESHNGVDRYKVVELLLDKGVDPNIQDNQGRTPLHYVCNNHCKGGSVEIAKLLLRRGADPDLKDKDDKKPVDYAYYDSDFRKLFGTINYGKATSLGAVTLLTTAGSIALISGVADAYIGKVWCSTLAVGMAAVALYCAYCAIKIMFFSGPSTEFTEARAEFLNSQKLPNPAGGA